MKKQLVIAFLFCAVASLVWVPSGFSWTTYSSGCGTCHGDSSEVHPDHGVGEEGGVNCSSCHVATESPATSTCIVCHPVGDPGKCELAIGHEDSQLYEPEGDSCLTCHAAECDEPPAGCETDDDCPDNDFFCDGVPSCSKEGSETTGLIDDSIMNIDPILFEKIVLPHLIRYYEAFPSPKRAFHCCGNINNFLEAISKMDLTNYDLMGENVDIKRARAFLKDTFITQIVDFRILRDGSEDKIKNYIKSLLEKISNDSNYAVVVEGQKNVALSKARVVRDTIFEWNKGKMANIKKSDGI